MNSELIMTLPGPESILRKQFPNGVTVLVHENPWSSTAAVFGTLFAGSCLDIPEKRGTASFVSASLLSGTRSLDGSRISEYLESTGAELSFGCGPDTCQFRGNCLSEDLPRLLRLLKEILAEPSFPEPAFRSLKQQALAGYETDPDGPEDPLVIRFRQALWLDEHPYGHMDPDPEEDISGITRDDLYDFHSRFFGPKGLIIALSGGFRGQEIMDLCEEIFGSWEKTQEMPDVSGLFPPAVHHPLPVLSHRRIEGRKESSLLIGTFGPAAGDPDILSARIGNEILGGDSMLGRIGNSVRIGNGLAYSAFSSLESRKNGGSWRVQAGVDPANLNKACKLICAELRRFTEELPSQREVEEARAWYLGNLILAFRKNAGMASALHGLEYFQREPDFYRRLPERLSAVTPEKTLETARKWIDPGAMVIITTGPEENSIFISDD